jgi:hypothetical protein
MLHLLCDAHEFSQTYQNSVRVDNNFLDYHDDDFGNIKTSLTQAQLHILGDCVSKYHLPCGGIISDTDIFSLLSPICSYRC